MSVSLEMDFRMEDPILPLYKRSRIFHRPQPQLIIIIVLLLITLLFTIIVCISTFSQLRGNEEIGGLPGAPAVHFKQYSDYFKLENGRNIHYWFMESQNNAASDPLILWLTGGPGCSGMDAILTEWGPLLVNDDGATLRLNEYGWNKNASILTIETPGGVGYSTYDEETALNDDEAASDNWETLTIFFETFPNFKNNDLYIMGESYGGVYVPTLVNTIYNRMNKVQMNLKGMAIGNGKLDYSLQANTRILFQRNHGLLEEKKYKQAISDCCNGTFEQCDFYHHKDKECHLFGEDRENFVWDSSINPYNIKSPCTMEEDQGNSSNKYAPHCLNVTAIYKYMNRDDVRKTLNIKKGLPNWQICSHYVATFYNRTYLSMKAHIADAIQQGLKVMIYNGDLDMVCDYIMGEKFTENFEYEVTKPRSEYYVNKEFAGFHTEYRKQLHFVTVKDAGHMVPTDKPAAAFHIIQSFIFDKPF